MDVCYRQACTQTQVKTKEITVHESEHGKLGFKVETEKSYKLIKHSAIINTLYY